MSCKLAVKRRSNSREVIGDCVSVHDSNEHLGRMVEPLGGAFVIIDIIDADKNNPHLIKLTKHWKINNEHHHTFDREFNLSPSVEGDEFFNELISTGRVSATIQQVIDRTVSK